MSEGDTSGTEMQADYQRAQAVKEMYEQELMTKANVLGVGIGIHKRDGEPTGGVSLVVMVTHKVPLEQLAPEDVIPSEIDGVPVDVQAVGDVIAHE